MKSVLFGLASFAISTSYVVAQVHEAPRIQIHTTPRFESHIQTPLPKLEPLPGIQTQIPAIQSPLPQIESPLPQIESPLPQIDVQPRQLNLDQNNSPTWNRGEQSTTTHDVDTSSKEETTSESGRARSGSATNEQGRPNESQGTSPKRLKKPVQKPEDSLEQLWLFRDSA